MDEKLKGHLDAVFNEFLEVFPAALHGDLKSNLYFAGGCVVNHVLGVPIVDYDMFVKSSETRDSLCQYFQETEHAAVKVKTKNAITLELTEGKVVQLVTRFTGDTDRIFKDFDFEHTKSYYDPARNTIKYDADIIMNKKLVYTGEKDQFTLNTLKRLCKFVARGWNPTNETIINLHRAIQNRPHIDTPEEREMQTVGFYGSSFT